VLYYSTIYLAVKSGIDPSSVNSIDFVKKPSLKNPIDPY